MIIIPWLTTTPNKAPPHGGAVFLSCVDSLRIKIREVKSEVKEDGKGNIKLTYLKLRMLGTGVYNPMKL